MARSGYFDVIWDIDDTTGAAEPLDDIEVHVYLAGTTDPADIYQARSGASAVDNPFLTVDGRVEFFADPGQYDIFVTDTQVPARVADKTVPFDSVPGASQGIPGSLIANGGINTARIADGAVTTGKIADDAINGDKIADLVIVAAHMAANAITAVKLATDAVETAKIKDAAVTSAKLADGSVIASKIPDGSIVAGKLDPAAGVSFVPVGSVLGTARSTAPAGFLLCDGASVLRAGDYAALFSAIGTTFGSVDGSHFNLPDLRGRVPMGVDGAAGRISGNDSLGAFSGEQNHTLAASEMPVHSHQWGNNYALITSIGSQADQFDGGAAAGAGVVAYVVSSGGFSTSNAGSGGSHNNMQPYQTINYIIKY